VSSLRAAIDCAKVNAPYLRESLERFPELEQAILHTKIETIIDDLIKGIPVVIGDFESEMSILRILKRKLHLVVALVDIAKIWDWVRVTETLTQLADLCVHRILSSAAKNLEIDGSKDNPVPGLFVLAVGKYGARELNYSSDIDFNVFYDSQKIIVPNPARAERTLIKLIQMLVKGLEGITEDGYIFRTDLRLRPDPRSNAIAVSTSTAERYYETLGQNWERAAMIKARVCAGDREAGEDFKASVLAPFIWRRNLDYAAIEDILAIKRQIHAKIGQGEIEIAGHHLKLGTGGIREIEFYAQVQQLILGGRHDALRSMRTVDALAALSAAGFTKTADTSRLCGHYGVLRDLEHVSQMIDDEQTHLVPTDIDKRKAFAALAGFGSTKEMEVSLRAIITDVHKIYTNLFPDAAPLSSEQGNLVFTGVEPDPATLSVLQKLRFKEAGYVWQEMATWLGGRIKATRAERSRELLTAIAPRIIEYCAESPHPDAAFVSFGRFIESLKSGVSVLSMFNQRPEHLRLVISLLAKSPFIADAVAAKPEILDALSVPDFLDIPENQGVLGSAEIGRAEDLEDAMNAARRWVREERFRISAALLSGRITAQAASRFFSALAENSIKELLPFAVRDVERRSGPIEGSIAILGMGKLATKDLNATSDLDIMVLYDPDPNESNAQQIYARITQRLISALSAVTEEGGMFEVDMALRPSGRAGPVAVTKESFLRYYKEKAWTWEFMALSRSRILTTYPGNNRTKYADARALAISAERQDLDISEDISSMLTRLRKEKLPKHDFDLKNVEGGIRDIEFLAQKSFLLNEQIPRFDTLPISEILVHSSAHFSESEIDNLINIYAFYLDFLQFTSVQSGKVEPKNLSEIAKFLDLNSKDDLLKKLKVDQNAVCVLVDRFIYQAA